MTRAAFLERIRKEIARAPAAEGASTAPRPPHPEDAAEAVRRQMAERWPEALETFVREFERVGGVFHRVPDQAGARAKILEIARLHEATALVAWDPASLGLELGSLASNGLAVTTATSDPDDEARQRHREDSAHAQIGVTGADFVLAETGTMILLSGRGRPRVTSLLPETHVAVFDRTRLVESLAQVGVLLEALHADPARSMSGAMINFITGPSRTADIELTLTRGVHGPKAVHAIFVEAR